MTEVSIAVAFAAGVLSFISPCVLALVPVYLAFLGNAAVAERTSAGTGGRHPRAAILPQALLFVGGLQRRLHRARHRARRPRRAALRIPEIRQVAGIAVIVVGVLTTGVFGPVLDRFSVGVDASALPAARGVRAVALGAFVAVGWTPCIGPVLGAIFTMGASSGSAPAVALLLTAYSVGLAVPFLLAALAFPRLRPLIDGCGVTIEPCGSCRAADRGHRRPDLLQRLRAPGRPLHVRPVSRSWHATCGGIGDTKGETRCTSTESRLPSSSPMAMSHPSSPSRFARRAAGAEPTIVSDHDGQIKGKTDADTATVDVTLDTARRGLRGACCPVA